jgi:uncharacterized integral membrane protein
MSAPHADTILGGYRLRLEEELNGLPRARREEIIAEVDAHIRDARTADAAETDADLLNLLDRLGDPGVIGTEARERFDVAEPASAGGREVIALLLLVVGPFIVPVVTWVLGAMLVWSSVAWSAREKRNSLAWSLIVIVGLAIVGIVIAMVSSPGTSVVVSILPGAALFVVILGTLTSVLSGLLLASALARRRPRRAR